MAAGLVGGMSTMVCETTDQVRGYSRRDFLRAIGHEGEEFAERRGISVFGGGKDGAVTEAFERKAERGLLAR